MTLSTSPNTSARFLGRFGKLGRGPALFPVLILVILVGSLSNSAFLTTDNVINVLQASSVLAIVVLAESLVLISGKFDVSLESIVGVAPMIGACLMLQSGANPWGIGLNPYLAIVATLAVGGLIGLANGVLVTFLKLNAFITTLAMLILLRGLTVGVSGGTTIFDLPDGFIYLGSATWFGIPVSIWLAGAMYAIVGLFLRWHYTGRSLYAVGGNALAARVAGIRTDRVLVGVFIAAGVLAAFAGLLATGRIASATASQGGGLIFSAFAAAVLGGISLEGGRGSVGGALLGVLLLAIITNILTLQRVDPFWIDACNGAIILVALIVTRLTSSDPARSV